ncbi:Membrane associated eicosanoid/glutathione metabolism-like domain protein [Tolypocladium paradoxum]|uniref:Membrane associated eicosanoid/glutathione metabolism-like domain protein n=1 Tax=Tolypocladium paradoxum TaxID=94208 RepID=A0A2S4L3K6_9HYPO|nr:Membrane associated eicosanoid/glutathione metabolism-like domain protein [Tolypocladium paradoxum]
MASYVHALIAGVGLDPSKNYSLFTCLKVPAALAACLLPHYAAVLAAGLNIYDNAHPRNFRDNLTRDTSRKQRILRSEAASLNGFETLGFFAAGVAAANHAGLDAPTLNALSVGYVLLRAAFVLSYVYVRNRRLSWLRTILWNVASALSIMLWVRAGLKVL